MLNNLEPEDHLQTPINSRLKRIANILLLNASFILNLGLLNGKIGIAIFLFNYARYVDKKVYADYAGELIDEIYEEISTHMPIDFSNGLTGIGWGIEYLVQNGYLEADTNEILEDIDNTIYQKILSQPIYSELEGLLLYQLARFKAKKNESREKELLKKHTLLCLLGECEKLLLYRNFKGSIIYPDSDLLRTIQFFLIEVDNAELFPIKTKKLLEYLTTFFEIAYSEDLNRGKGSIISQANTLVWYQLVYSNNEEKDSDLILYEAFKFIDNQKNWDNFNNRSCRDNIGLRNGLTGIGMVLLQLTQRSDFKQKKINSLKKKEPLCENHNISVFIFKSNARGMIYGIGSYIRELTESLLTYTDVRIYVVAYHNKECDEFTIDELSSRHFNINIPPPKQSNIQSNLYDKRYASSVVNILNEVIHNEKKIIFQINYIDDLSIIKKLKTIYNYPIISIVHFAGWQQLFLGNKHKLKDLNIGKPSNNIEFTLFKEKEMYQLADHIVSVTQYMKDFLVKEYDIISDKIDVVPNGINYCRYQSISKEEKLILKNNLGFNPKERIILFSGRIDYDKGIFFLIKAFKEVCKVEDNLHLVIMGQGNVHQCLKECESIYSKITLTGFLPTEKVMEFYQIADLGVIPSIYDHCPYSALEMIANKIPLIFSNIDGLNEILNDSQCLFIEPCVSDTGEITYDINNIRDSILYMINNDLAVNEHKENAYIRLVDKFPASNMASAMKNTYMSFFQ